MAVDSGSPRQRASPFAYLLAILVCAAAAGVQLALQPVIGDRFPFAAFWGAVAFVGWSRGFGPALASALLSATAADYLLLPPIHSFAIERPADWVALSLFTGVAVFTAAAMRDLRRHARAERLGRVEAVRALGRTTVLQELAAAVSRAKVPREVTDAALTELLHWFDAAAGAIVAVHDSDATYDIAQAVGYPTSAGGTPDVWSALRRAAVDQAIQRQEVVAVESTAIAPLVAAGRGIGAIVLSFNQPRTIDDDQRRLLLAAGGHVGLALRRARAYEQAERARADGEAFRVRAAAELRDREKAEEALRESESRYRALAARTNRLYALSAGLSEAIATDDVAKVIVALGKVVVGASAGSVVLVVEDGRELQTIYAEGGVPEGSGESARRPVEPGLCSTKVVRTKRPVYVGSFVEWQKLYPSSAALAADGGYASAAFLPLIAEGVAIGVLSFQFTAPVNFNEEYRALLESVAQHCAQALDRGRLYEATERARAEAELANKSKDDFLSTVSHELRTPLNAMLGWAAMLRSGSIDPDRTSRAVEAIFTNATRQAHLIEELLDVSRIVAGRAALDIREVDLAENLNGAVEAIMPLADAQQVELRLEAPESPVVRGDPRRLEQVFLNLLTNAVKFTPKGGRITARLIVGESTADVRVSDTGAGIDPEFLPHVFERFRQGDSTTTRHAGGLGLGLYIARHLVEAQGGTIGVHSEGTGQGATFTVSLPLAVARRSARLPAADAPRADDAEHRQVPVVLEGVRVLLVDDDADGREMMAAALDAAGAKVMTATSAREALDALSKSCADVLLSDIAMPGQDGYELIRSVRGSADARLARIPAVAVTACASDADRRQALDAGFQTHVPKPVRPRELVDAVSALAHPVEPQHRGASYDLRV